MVARLTGRRAALVMALLTLSLPLTSSQEHVPSEEWSAEGGHSVLMEQYTATWCDVCASVDVWMPDFTSANGNRVARVAVHDTFDDPLGTPITAHRAQYHSTALAAPSFWFDGSLLFGGAPDKASLHRALLSAEGQRADDTRMVLIVRALSASQISISVELSDIATPDSTQVSLFALRASASIGPEQATNGITEHHDVAFAYAETSIEGDAKWSYPDASWDDATGAGQSVEPGGVVVLTRTLELPEGVATEELRIVAVHESSSAEGSEPSTMGAVAVSLGNQGDSDGVGLLVPLSLILALSTLAITARSRR